MARGIPHSEETRAAVLAALLAGQGVMQVAEAFKLNHSTVVAWRDAAGVTSTPVEREKRQAISELVADYLLETFTTLAAQQRYFRDNAWLKRQNASDVATLHGVSADKAFRLLAALQVNDQDEPEA